MKKPKVKLDSASMQAFFLNHVEKILFGAVLLLMALLVYQGMGLTTLESGKSPDVLMQNGQQTLTFINTERTQEVMEDRNFVANVREQAGISRMATDPAHYFLPMPLTKPHFPKLEPRKDPELLAPSHVIVVPVVGPLAALAKTGEIDPLYELPPEDEEEPARPLPKAKPKAKKAAGPPNYPGGYEGSDYDGGMGGYGRQRRPAAKPKATAKGKGGSTPYSAPSSYDEGMMYDDGGMSGYPGMGGYGSARADLYPEATQFGFQSNHPMTIARSVRAMVVMVVVPYERQWEEHEKALMESLDYDPQRDIPIYELFRVERADVTDIPHETDPAVLEPRFAAGRLNVNQALIEAVGAPPSARFPRGIPPLWAGSPQELIDPLYWDEKLTHPAPPFMQRDLWDVLTHPEIPLASARTRRGAEAGTEEPVRPDLGDLDDLPGAGVRRGPGGMPGSGGMPGGYGMSGGYGSDAGYGSGMGGMGGYGSDMGYGGGPYGMSGSAAAFTVPKYKLIRFTDTTVEHGKIYRYRVRALLHDPNRPNIADPAQPQQTAGRTFVAPNPASLDVEVQTRLKDVEARDAAASAASGTKRRTWWRETPWSEVSEAVELPPARRFYAGAVNPGSVAPMRIDGRTIPVPISQPDATALAVIWDELKVVDVPAESKVVRGSVLNFTQDVKVIHPVTKELIDLEKYPFVTGAVVADIQGGEEIPRLDKDRSADNRITAPGELLVFDADGRLQVQSEVEDIEMFRRFLPKPESERRPAGGMPGGYDPSMGSDASGYPDAGMMPGDGYPSGGRQRRQRGSGP